MNDNETRLIGMKMIDGGYIGRGKKCPVTIRREDDAWYLTGSSLTASIDEVIKVRTRSGTRPWTVIGAIEAWDCGPYAGTVSVIPVSPGSRILSTADKRRIVERAGRAEIWDGDRPTYGAA